ncbi:hypothetical protein [Pelosinus fermentans]|uniref:Uncharacterized protein n=1 Tax=Pelosinus fermentans JBW45 TaxID=1192197 RepID=I8U120_9FIRM|nr:hypothetical protein [Pelosinus fermentans]AJQ29474.1 hypothetical protein JBW_04141 [Pelosinus fermentans JBW45]
MENHEEPFEIYSEEEMEVIESHIEEHFGPFANVLHEIASTDIHGRAKGTVVMSWISVVTICRLYLER